MRIARTIAQREREREGKNNIDFSFILLLYGISRLARLLFAQGRVGVPVYMYVLRTRVSQRRLEAFSFLSFTTSRAFGGE